MPCSPHSEKAFLIIRIFLIWIPLLNKKAFLIFFQLLYKKAGESCFNMDECKRLVFSSLIAEGLGVFSPPYINSKKIEDIDKIVLILLIIYWSWDDVG